ncbi:ribonuclease III [Geobacter sp. FeAm09]|uniref:ribonuclease III n=1 Tax=Geobacter sp. FeAm09 TaxID=2597769 RepID=UPI0011EF5C54|nr:ribonuclease III [Geobacter sp. FeAm09]QEM68409.1 ribonuclease III [Geobacter sp. FeAm09]
MTIDYTQLEERLTYIFRDRSLACRALTHPSWQHERSGVAGDDYQRLEFLGDAVLGMVLAEMLYSRFPDWNEGDLSRFRAHLAGQGTLAGLARSLDLGSFIRLGRGEEQTLGRSKESILSDVLEALIAAVYQDGGLEAARTLVSRLFGDLLAAPGCREAGRDAKSELQELLSARGLPPPEYRLSAESGPPHDRSFHFQLLVGGDVTGEGEGRSKKTAQQAAAAQALERLSSKREC